MLNCLAINRSYAAAAKLQQIDNSMDILFWVEALKLDSLFICMTYFKNTTKVLRATITCVKKIIVAN